MPPHPDAIADCVLAAFRALPLKAKPRVHADGRQEWVPLAGIVLSRDGTSARLRRHELSDVTTRPSKLTCVALATGMKCLPRAKLAGVQGNALHDWHAEVLALRGFNRWLVDECADLANAGLSSHDAWLEWRSGHSRQDPPENTPYASHSPPFQMCEDVSVHMYCSEAPCGDASMELTMAEQDDATPWATNPSNAHEPADEKSTEQEVMLGRGHFDRLGIVRRKPARADAPVTWSKSCSDKLALKQCTGLTNAMVDLLVSPIFLSTLVMPQDRCVPRAVERAWGPTGRMQALSSIDPMICPYRPFQFTTTARRFEFEKTKEAKASNLAVLATPRRTEVIINGVLQGRKLSDVAGACSASRRRIWETVNSILALISPHAMIHGPYRDVKNCTALQQRREIKDTARALALKPWVCNSGDEDWSL